MWVNNNSVFNWGGDFGLRSIVAVSFFSQDVFVYFMCVSMFVHHTHADPLELKFQVAVSHLMQVLKAEPGSLQECQEAPSP